jgi:hypothetical protein
VKLCAAPALANGTGDRFQRPNLSGAAHNQKLCIKAYLLESRLPYSSRPQAEGNCRCSHQSRAGEAPPRGGDGADYGIAKRFPFA